MTMDHLLLTIPEQHGYQDPAVERRPRRVKAWIKELPLLNAPVAVPMLIEALEALNAQAMPEKERMELLELYREPAEAVFTSFDRRRMEKEMRGEAKENFRQQLLRLFGLLADGYKLILLSGHRQGRRLDGDALLLKAACRAMQQITGGILQAYRLYAPLPPFAFMELHQIYWLAEKQAVLDTPFHKKERHNTLGLQYKRLMLLTIADPYHLGDGEVLTLLQALEPVAHLCRIGQQLPQTGPEQEGRFLIDLESDSPPRPFDRERTAEQPRVLDVRAVATALNDRRDDKRLRRLLPKLSVIERRRLKRRPACRHIEISMGIQAIHALLLGRGGGEAWEVANESAKGYLLRHEKPVTVLGVGEILAVRDPRDGGQPMLAVIRWMRSGANGQVETGIEVMPGDPVAVECAIDGKAGSLPALALPALPALHLPSSLIAPGGMVMPGDRLNLLFLTGPAGQRQAALAGKRLLDSEICDRIVLVAA